MKIVLIHPNHKNSTDSRLDPPLGLLYIARNLLNHGYNVEICDLSGIESYDIPYADIYGITVYITSIQETKNIISKCKEINPNCKIIVGGAHPTARPNDFPYVDHVIMGYGEVSMVDIVKNNVTQHIIRGKLPDNMFLFPAYELINPNTYNRRINNQVSLPLLTSRGCCYKCFPAGTKVIVSNGINKSINKINIGDKLIAYDNGILVETEVKKLYKHNKQKLLKITFENGGVVKCTYEHPFYVKEKWVNAENLKVGDEIYSINYKDKLSFSMKLYNPMFKQEVKNKTSKTRKHKIMTGEMKNNLKLFWQKHDKNDKIHVKYKNPDKWKEMCINQSNRMRLNNPMYSEKTRNKVSKTQKIKIKRGEIVPYFSKEPKEKWHMKYVSTEKEWNEWKIKNSNRVRNDNPMYKPHVNNLFNRKINKTEQKLYDILNEYFPQKYEFTGYLNKIGWFYPDFTHVDGEKKIIELYGCYWHKCKQCNLTNESDWWLKHHKKRIKNFEKFGYKTLEIWEHELQDIPSLIKKIGSFTYNGLKIIKIEELSRKQNVYNFHCEPYENYFVSTNKDGKYILSHNCSFCGLEQMHKELNYKMNFASSDVVISHIRKIKEMGINAIAIQDDIFTLKPSRLYRILDEIKKLNISIRCMGRAGIDKEETYAKLADSGIEQISWGIESGSQYILDRMKKDVTVQDNYNVIKWAKKYGINTRAFFILGFPGETKETIEETKKFIIESDPDQYFISNFIPYPGTDVGDNPEKYGITWMSNNYDDYYQVSKDGTGGITIDTKWLSRYELKELELELRDWLKKNKEFRGEKQTYERNLYNIS